MVEGPLNNLQPSMIQFSKPRRTLNKSMDQFRRHEVSAREYLSTSTLSSDGMSPARSLHDLPFLMFFDFSSSIRHAQSVRRQLLPHARSDGLHTFRHAVAPFSGDLFIWIANVYGDGRAIWSGHATLNERREAQRVRRLCKFYYLARYRSWKRR